MRNLTFLVAAVFVFSCSHDRENVQSSSALHEDAEHAENIRFAEPEDLVAILESSSDQQLRLDALRVLTHRLSWAGGDSHGPNPSPAQAARYWQRYPLINDLLWPVFSADSNFADRFIALGGEHRSTMLKMLGYLHPMTQQKPASKPDVEIASLMDISSIREEVYAEILKTGDVSSAGIVLQDVGFDFSEYAEHVVPYLMKSCCVNYNASNAIDRIAIPPDEILDSLVDVTHSTSERLVRESAYNAIARNGSEEAVSFLIEEVLDQTIVRGDEWRHAGKALDSALDGIRNNPFLQRASARKVVEVYQSFCEAESPREIQNLYPTSWQYGANLIEVTGNVSLLMEGVNSNEGCEYIRAMRYLVYIDFETAQKIFQQIQSDEEKSRVTKQRFSSIMRQANSMKSDLEN